MTTWQDFAPSPRELELGQEWHVFLSYRSVDRAWVINLYDVLRHHGYEVFLDQVALVPGDLLIRELAVNLGRSQSGVLVWSRAASDSKWVEQEYWQMQQRSTTEDFRFIPITVDDSVLPPFVDSKLFLDFSAYPEGPNGGELLRFLSGLSGQPLSEDASRFANEQDEAAASANHQIGSAIAAGNNERLLELSFNDDGVWASSAALGCYVAEGLIRLDRPGDALTTLAPLGDRFPRSIRPRQLSALALANRAEEGDLEHAQLILGELEQAGHDDPETLGIYARTWMDRYADSRRLPHLERSRDLYAQAFAGARDDYFSGVNAAAKSAMLGDTEQARTFAQAVIDIVGTEPVAGDYWLSATIAEAHLLMGAVATAIERYRQAVAIAPDELGSHGTTRRQAKRLVEALAIEPDIAARLLSVFD